MTIDNVVFYNKDTKEEVFRIDNVEECVFEDWWGNRHTERKLYKYVIELADGKKMEVDGYTVKQGEDEVVIRPWGDVKIYWDK